jgi:hypothetical protein
MAGSGAQGPPAAVGHKFAAAHVGFAATPPPGKAAVDVAPGYLATVDAAARFVFLIANRMRHANTVAEFHSAPFSVVIPRAFNAIAASRPVRCAASTSAARSVSRRVPVLSVRNSPSRASTCLIWVTCHRPRPVTVGMRRAFSAFVIPYADVTPLVCSSAMIGASSRPHVSARSAGLQSRHAGLLGATSAAVVAKFHAASSPLIRCTPLVPTSSRADILRMPVPPWGAAYGSSGRGLDFGRPSFAPLATARARPALTRSLEFG